MEKVLFIVFSLYVICDKLWLFGFNIVFMEQVMLSPNGLFMLHQITLPFKNFSIEFTNFKTWCILFRFSLFSRYTNWYTMFNKTTLFILKSFFYKKCSTFELSCYIYSLNYGMKFESYIILYLFMKMSSFHYFHRLDWNILKWNRVDKSLSCVL